MIFFPSTKEWGVCATTNSKSFRWSGCLQTWSNLDSFLCHCSFSHNLHFPAYIMKQPTEWKEWRGSPMCRFSWFTTAVIWQHRNPKTQVYHYKHRSRAKILQEASMHFGQVASFPNPVKHAPVAELRNVTPLKKMANAFKTTRPALPPWDRMRRRSSNQRRVMPFFRLPSSFFNKLLSLVFSFLFAALFCAFSLRFPRSGGEDGGRERGQLMEKIWGKELWHSLPLWVRSLRRQFPNMTRRKALIFIITRLVLKVCLKITTGCCFDMGKRGQSIKLFPLILQKIVNHLAHIPLPKTDASLSKQICLAVWERPSQLQGSITNAALSFKTLKKINWSQHLVVDQELFGFKYILQ